MPNPLSRSMAVLAASALLLTGCAASNGDPIRVTGSATINPVTQLIAVEGGHDVEQTADGTLDGFGKFCAGESHINNASEAIPGAGQPVDYMAQCEENGVEYLELPIGLDALSVVRNHEADFAENLTMAELRMIWEPESEVTTWSDVRSEWPGEEITLVGRPTGSGTFDYFTEHVNGQAGEIRDDYRTTDDMAELASWIAEDPNAIGFMGVGNYLAAEDVDRARMATVKVDGVAPSLDAVQRNEYQPLTRLLYIYVSTQALEEHAGVGDFVSDYLEEAPGALPRVHFYRLPDNGYEVTRSRFQDRVTGTVMDGDPHRSAEISEWGQDARPQNP